MVNNDHNDIALKQYFKLWIIRYSSTSGDHNLKTIYNAAPLLTSFYLVHCKRIWVNGKQTETQKVTDTSTWSRTLWTLLQFHKMWKILKGYDLHISDNQNFFYVIHQSKVKLRWKNLQKKEQYTMHWFQRSTEKLSTYFIRLINLRRLVWIKPSFLYDSWEVEHYCAKSLGSVVALEEPNVTSPGIRLHLKTKSACDWCVYTEQFH